jgi:hypothetical protein
MTGVPIGADRDPTLNEFIYIVSKAYSEFGLGSRCDADSQS